MQLSEMHGARISIKIKMKYLSKALDFNLRETFPKYTTNNTKNILLKFLQKVGRGAVLLRSQSKNLPFLGQ